MPEILWQKSSFSGDDANRDCVEVASASAPGALFLRESDEPGAVLRLPVEAMRGLLGALRGGR